MVARRVRGMSGVRPGERCRPGWTSFAHHSPERRRTRCEKIEPVRVLLVEVSFLHELFVFGCFALGSVMPVRTRSVPAASLTELS